MRVWPLLAPFSLLYGGVTGLRNKLYDRGVFPSHASGISVLSVGNLTVGGSGKSPLTAQLARELRALAPDLSLAIVSRGYGRRTRGPQVVADGQQVLLTPDLGGDEPVMLAEVLGDVPVVVAEKRSEGVELAVERFGTAIALLDDGFQHRRIERDLDLVLLDASEPDWIWRPLPAGRLRELPGALKRAHVVVLTGRVERSRMQSLASFVRGQSDALIVEGGLEPEAVIDHETGERRTPGCLHGAKVAAACGIARPERYFATLTDLGAEIVYRSAWRDHAWTTREQRERLKARAIKGDAEALVITAKDAVKWPRGEGGLPVWVLEAGWSWGDGVEELRGVLAGFAETARGRAVLHT